VESHIHICALSGQIYRVRLPVSSPCSRDSLTVRTVALDTGSGANLISKDALPEGSLVYPLHNSPKITDAQGGSLGTVGVVHLCISLCSRVVEVPFIVVDRLAIPLLLGTGFIDENVVAILPKERLVQFGNDSSLQTVSMVGREEDYAANIQATETLLIPAYTEVVIAGKVNRCGLSVVRPTWHRTGRAVHAKNGVIELPPIGETFALVVANFSAKPRLVRSGQSVGVAEPISQMSVVEEETPEVYREDLKSWRDTVDLGHLPIEFQERVRNLLSKHQEMWSGKLGHINAVRHHIPTIGAPVATQPYRAGPRAREDIDREVNRMLNEKVIEPSSGEWASPVVLIPKPDGTVRFCVDYRRVNALTIKDQYALPRMDDCLDSLGEARVFSTLDANSGYWQIVMDEVDKVKTAFTCHRGLYQFQRMPFGLCNAPATFQRAIDVILSSVRWQCALTYLDDIIVFSATLEQHLHDLDRVLTLLHNAGVTLKLRKCQFFRDSVRYLGHIVGFSGLSIDEENTVAVRKAIPPNSRSSLRSFLGLCNVYRRFVKGFSTLAAPLTKLLRKDQPERFVLNEEQLKAVENLKESILNPPVLALPVSGRPYIVETDASANQLGCVLLQEQQDKSLRPIGFWSRACNKAEQNYSPTEREALAIIWAVKMLRPYLERVRFSVRTDHAALRWLFGATAGQENPRLVRWRLALAEHDFSVSYRPGKIHSAPDAMSRIQTFGMQTSEIEDEIPVLVIPDSNDPLPTPTTPSRSAWQVTHLDPLPAISRDELIEAQADDPWCQDQICRMEHDQRWSLSSEGFLMFSTTPGTSDPRWVAPSSLRERIMTLAHYPRSSCHPGSSRLASSIIRYWYWPSVSRDCIAFVRRCPSCQAQVLKRGPRRTTPLQMFPPNEPLEFLAMDILGPLPVTSRGNRYVLVITDRFSKLTQTVALPVQTASVVARAFIDRWICVYGIPVTLLTDNGTQFTSKFLAIVTKLLGVHHVFTSAYRAATNGQAERFNATLVDSIAHYVTIQEEWDLELATATFAYNNTPHTSTGFTPFELVLARPPSALFLTPSEEDPFGVAQVQDKARYREKLLARVEKISKAARETNQIRTERYKKLYDLHVRARNRDIQVGDKVFVKTFVLEPARSPKLEFPVMGPYTVTRLGESGFDLITASGTQRVHSDRVIKAPSVHELPPGISWAPTVPPQQKTPKEHVDHIIERAVAHRFDDQGMVLVKIRWAGCGPEEDTWEPSSYIPLSVLEQYAAKKNISLELLCH
jgi:transposase InsO family protein